MWLKFLHTRFALSFSENQNAILDAYCVFESYTLLVFYDYITFFDFGFTYTWYLTVSQ